jgi:hypothetical protein
LFNEACKDISKFIEQKYKVKIIRYLDDILVASRTNFDLCALYRDIQDTFGVQINWGKSSKKWT